MQNTQNFASKKIYKPLCGLCEKFFIRNGKIRGFLKKHLDIPSK